MASGQRIAVIGSGISGLSAAHYLSAQHRVSLFEAAPRLGGHTATVEVSLAGRDYAIDTGFIVFNDRTYPHFQRLLAELDVASQATEMSFSVHEAHRDFEYNGHSLRSLFAQRRNLVSPPFYRLLGDILRFNRAASDDLDAGRLDPTITLGEYLDAAGFGDAFRRYYLLPMGAAIWSASISELTRFPVAFFVRFFRNHGLLSLSDRPQWRTLTGGSSRYIPALTRRYAERIHQRCAVSRIRRDAGGVDLNTALGAARFRREDYLAPHDLPLKQAVRERLASELGDERAAAADGRVCMLAQLRLCGVAFNPLTLYYLYDRHERLRAVLGEVTNTPWGERHVYACAVDPVRHLHGATFTKALHVSPFNPMDMDYRWRFNAPGERLYLHMENCQAGTRHFDATLTLTARPATRRVLLETLSRQPWMSLKTVAAIHFEALRLWAKRVPVYTRHRRGSNHREHSP